MQNLLSTFDRFFASRNAVLFLSHLLVIVLTFTIFYSFPSVRYASVVEPTIEDIAPSTFYAAYSKDPDSYVFLDVRSKEVYNNLHAVGSKLQPLHTLYTERYNLPKNVSGKTIVLICSGGVASGVGFSYLQHYGFRNILRVEGGIENWQAQGLPIEGLYVL